MSAIDDARAYRVAVDDLLTLRAQGQRLRRPGARPSRSALAGAYRSRYQGRGMDYRESRHYQAGDDIRNMDWRITARSGRPHIKVFDEERERPVVVLVDLGASMFFASQGVFKSVQAARLAALIGWSAIARGDRIGGLLFTDANRAETHLELSPAGGRRGQMRLIQALVQAGDPSPILGHAVAASEPANESSSKGDATAGRFGGDPSTESPAASGLSAALLRLRRVARPGSLVYLISDFYSADADSERHLGQLARHCDLQALQLADPLELAPPPPGAYGISDGRRRLVIDTRVRAQRERYAAQLQQHQDRVQQLTEANGIALIRCLTTDDAAQCLASAFPARFAKPEPHQSRDQVPPGESQPDPRRQTEGKPRTHRPWASLWGGSR
jgi:uncharacterized protein (DUF58 family)